MKIYADVVPQNLGYSIHRVMNELKKYAPNNIEFVSKIDDCDLQIVPVIGEGQAKQIMENDKPYIVWQLCYLTTEYPYPEYWQPIWEKAESVFSYYHDLPVSDKVNFHISPIGYDPNTFYSIYSGMPKRYDVMTIGYVDSEHGEALSNTIEYAKTLHIGGNIGLDGHPNYTRMENISDSNMNIMYNLSRYVVAIRYTEGFEMPVLEGAAAGAIPIVLDAPSFRRWFNGIALFVTRETMENGLKYIVTSKQGLIMPPNALLEFRWSTIARKFWESL